MKDNYTTEIIEVSSFAAVVADEIVLSISEAIEDNGKCFLCLAGGKTPASVYRLLARPPRTNDIDWKNVYVFFGDERWVDYDNILSNYKTAKETFLSQVPIPSENVFPVDTSLSSPKEAAKKYEENIKKILGDKAFDIMLLGVGEDGHMASIFPGSKLLEEDKGLCAESINPKDSSDRVTLTPKQIFSANKVFFLVKGEQKAEIVKTLLNEDYDNSTYPAGLFRDYLDKVIWFIDSAAAKQLVQTKG